MNMRFLISILSILFFTSCGEEDKTSNFLIVSKKNVQIVELDQTYSFAIETDAGAWEITNDADWLTLSSTSGTSNEAEIELSVESRSLTFNQTSLIITAGNAAPVSITVSQPPSEFLFELSMDEAEFSFDITGGTGSFNVMSEASSWQLTSDSDWVQLNPSSGGEGTTNVEITIPENIDAIRTAIVTLNAEGAPTSQLSISQDGNRYPNYNTDPIASDNTGMTSTAVELANSMTLGLNIGNTLEATGGETGWGNPRISNSFVQSAKERGFDAIRLPCAWDQYADQTTAEIDPVWLDRVKEVVQYCFDNDMYVILNIHWDGGWLENNVTPEQQEVNNAKQKAYWEQIATHLRDFDEHLIFAGANEPNVDNAEQMEVLMSYHQTFIDAVRSTGGRNSHRVLVIQGPRTDIEATNELFQSFPEDEVEDKLMMELHYYTPYQFTLMEEDQGWGNMFYYWGENFHSELEPSRNATWGEEEEMERLFEIVNQQFVQNGYPVILGEYGAYKRSGVADQELHEASVEYWNETVTRESIEKGMIPFYWDTGGIIDRNTGDIRDQGVLDAILNGANE